MAAWSHLPNAIHIDRVLASAKANPKEWDQASAKANPKEWEQAMGQAHDQARDQVWYQVSVRLPWRPAEWARGALMALATYDDCAKYLKLPIDQLNMLYQLTEHPACILLQPAVLVFAKEKELAQA
jgi:hypothetical protein